MADLPSTRPPSARKRWTRSRRDWLVASLLGLVIALVWAEEAGFFKDWKFSDPISYRGDAFFSAAVVAAARRGDYFPFTSKTLPSLGAPYVANWNDFPGTDDPVFWFVGQLAKVTDTIVAINIGYMFALISAGISMYFVARRFGFRREGAVLGGFLFGVSHYIFVRNVHHFSLTFIGIVPWNVLVMAYLGSRRGLPLKSKRFFIAAIATVLTGWSFIYYVFFAVQLYLLGALAGVMRHGFQKKRLGPVFALAGIFALSALSTSNDSIRSMMEIGPNPTAIARLAHEVELYALKPISFMTPPHLHRVPFMREIWYRGKAQAIVNGEEPGPYLGVLGFVFLIALAVTGLSVIARRKGPHWVLSLAATTAWMMIAHATGGLSSVLGLFHFVLFRSNNRASVVVLAIVMLFGAWAVPRVIRRLPKLARWAVCIVLGFAARWEQGGLVNPADAVLTNRAQADNDRHLVLAMEQVLPPGAMIFQLPAMHFPESPPIYGIDSYEMFRPCLFAKTFRFSHGDVKGRPNAEWKFRIASLPAEQMLAELKASGFIAILVNRKGYPDGGGALIAQLVASGCRIVAQSELNDNIALELP